MQINSGREKIKKSEKQRFWGRNLMGMLFAIALPMAMIACDDDNGFGWDGDGSGKGGGALSVPDFAGDR